MIAYVVALILAGIQLAVAILTFLSSKRNATGLKKLEISIDGRMEQLLQSARHGSFLEGANAEQQHPRPVPSELLKLRSPIVPQ